MIRGLRMRHRLVWTLLLPILAILLTAALLSRPAPPLMDGLPNATEYGEEAPEEATAGNEAPAPQDAPP